MRGAMPNYSYQMKGRNPRNTEIRNVLIAQECDSLKINRTVSSLDLRAYVGVRDSILL